MNWCFPSRNITFNLDISLTFYLFISVNLIYKDIEKITKEKKKKKEFHGILVNSNTNLGTKS